MFSFIQRNYLTFLQKANGEGAIFGRTATRKVLTLPSIIQQSSISGIRIIPLLIINSGFIVYVRNYFTKTLSKTRSIGPDENRTATSYESSEINSC